MPPQLISIHVSVSLNPVCVSDCPGLQCTQAVRRLRFQAQVLLDEGTSEQRGRFGELLVVLTTLQSVAWQDGGAAAAEMRLLGKANVDNLLMEMLWEKKQAEELKPASLRYKTQ